MSLVLWFCCVVIFWCFPSGLLIELVSGFSVYCMFLFGGFLTCWYLALALFVYGRFGCFGCLYFDVLVIFSFVVWVFVCDCVYAFLIVLF